MMNQNHDYEDVPAGNDTFSVSVVNKEEGIVNESILKEAVATNNGATRDIEDNK